MDADPQATPPSSPPLAAKKAAKKPPIQQLPDDPAGSEESASPSSSASTRPTKEHTQAASQSETAGASDEFAVLPAGDTPPIHSNSDVNEAASATRPDAEPLPAALPLQVDEQPPPSSEAAEAAEAAVQEAKRSPSPPADAAAEAPRPLSSSDAIVEEPHWSVRRPWTLASHSSWPAKAVAEDDSSREPSRAAARKEASPAAPPPPSPSSPNASRKQPAPSQASRRKSVEGSLPEWLSLLAEQDVPSPSPSPSTPKDGRRASPSARARATSSSPGPIRPPSTARPVLPQQTTRPASPEQAPSAQSPSKSAPSTLPKPPTPPDVRGPFAELVSYLQSLGDYDTSAVDVLEEQQVAAVDNDESSASSTDASGSTDDGTSTTALKFKGSRRACFQVVEDFESSLKRWCKNAYFNRRESLGYIDEAFQLYVSAYSQVFPADAQSTRLVKVFARCSSLRKDWHPTAVTLRALCDCLQQPNNLTANVMLLRLLRRQADSRRSMSGPEKFTMQRVCLQLLRSPSLLDRQRARTSVITAFTGGNDPLGSNAPLSMRCSLLLAWCQAAEGWAADAALQSIASNTEKDALETILADASYQTPLDSLTCKALEAITTWRALGHFTISSVRDQHSQSSFSISPGLFQWLRKLNSGSILQIQAAHDLILDAVLPAIPASYQYAEEYQRLFRRLNGLGIKVGATAWQRAIEALLGRRRDTVVRAHQYPSRARRFKKHAAAMSALPSTARQSTLAEPDLMQVHEAVLLYEASVVASQPALAAAQPLVQALLRQFPPRVEKAMAIWRRTQSQSKTPPVSVGLSWLPFSRLGFFRRASNTSAMNDEIDLVRSPQKIAALADTLLSHLLKSDNVYGPLVVGPELNYAVEIVTDLISEGRGAVVPLDRRLVYAFKILASLSARERRRVMERGQQSTTDDDFMDVSSFWSTLRGGGGEATTSASSWMDASDEWMYADLAMALAGRSVPKGPLKRDEQILTRQVDSHKYDAKPLVPLNIIVDCAYACAGRVGGEGAGMFSALLVQFGRLATYRYHYSNHLRRQARQEAAAMARHRYTFSFVPPDLESIRSAVRRLGALVMRQEPSSPGPNAMIVGAFMEASSRCEDYDMVHQIWRALTLSTVNAGGLGSSSHKPQRDSRVPDTALDPSAPTPGQRPVVTGLFLTIYLDSVGFCGDEAAGRRAWAFAKTMDERRLTDERIFSDTNLWTTWLEFLCRCGRLAEAVGPNGLDGMVNYDARPDAKTLSTVLAFALRKQRYDHSNDARRRRGEFAEGRDGGDGSGSGPEASEGEKIFAALKQRIQRGDFGEGMWETVSEDLPDITSRQGKSEVWRQ